MAQYANPQQFGAPMNNDGGYMERDEEWEREGLLDPAWEKQQRKVTAQKYYAILRKNITFLRNMLYLNLNYLYKFFLRAQELM